MRALLCCLLIVLLAGVALAAGSPLALVRDGKAAATIVVAADPAPSAQFAAVELQYHVRKITGAMLPIVNDETAVTGTRILVGENAATRKLRLRGRSFADQEYLIRFLPDTLVLLGRDSAAQETKFALPRRVPGKFGNAAEFDGERTALSIPDCQFDDQQGTLEAWVYLPAEEPTEKHGTILRLDGANPWTYHIIQRDMKSSRISYTTYDGTHGHGLATGPLAEGWYHVMGTWDAGTGKQCLYLNGKLVGTCDYVKTTCQGAVLGIGGIATGDRGAVGNPFKGLIDEVRVSKVVRTPEGFDKPYAVDAATGNLLHLDEQSGYPADATGQLGAAQPPQSFASNGTLFATYDFLERYCGVRWYAPGEIGLVCPQTKTLVVNGTDRRHKPDMEMRWIAGAFLFMPTAEDRVPEKDAQVWRLRMRLGGKWKTTGHSFYGYYDRYLKEHPDWFAQGYGTGQPPQMCYTSEGFIKQVVQDADDYFGGGAAKSGAAAGDDTFGLTPMDNSSWCKCPQCQALLNPAEKDNPQFNNGYASDYIYDFTNRVAQAVGKTHPDKWIGQLAYSTYAYHPDKVKLAPNIAVQMCLHTRNWWCPSMEANDRKVLSEWRSKEPNRPLALWLYYCFPALNAKYGNYHYFPGFFAHSVVKQMKLYHDATISGIFLENSSECGATYLMDQLEYYVTFKLADDPTQDGNKLIEEFFTKYYGAAAGPMRALYNRIEDLFSNPKYYPPEIQQSKAHQHQNEELAWGWVGTPARMAEMQKLMDQAVAAAKTDTEKERVRLFKVGIWDYMVEGRRLYTEHQQKRSQAIPAFKLAKVAPVGELRQSADLARVDWAKLPAVPGWGGLSGDPVHREMATRLGQDGRYLLIEFTDAVKTAALSASNDVWSGDDFELFFATGRDAKQYHQLCVGPKGGLAGLAWTVEPRANADWASGAVAASDTSAAGRWVLRLALPLNKLLPGGQAPAGKLYANFYRHSPGDGDLLAWQPTFASGFHDLKRLPELTLDGAEVGSLPLPAALVQAALGQGAPNPGLQRETMEWSNNWWDVANDPKLPRVLLIGDSVTCGYSGAVIKQLAGVAHVDRLGNSRNILDPIHLKETRVFLEEGKYKAIHFNNGLHGFHLTIEQYTQGLRDYVKLLRELAPGVPLVWASSTPITVSGHTDQLAPSNDVVIARNAAAAALMKELGIPVDDLYGLVVGHPELKSDTHHYNEAGRNLQGEAVANSLRPYLQ